MPLRGASPERWKRVDMAFLTGLDLQPVSLLALGGTYFVEDGHNRISVARFHGAEWIDAEVMRQGPLEREWISHRGRPPVHLTRGGVEVKMLEGVRTQSWERVQSQVRAHRS
jgi:hypothetical protein